MKNSKDTPTEKAPLANTANISSHADAARCSSGQTTPTLRDLAEIIQGERRPLPLEELQAMSPEKLLQMLHELQVHQIELGLQNEELRRTQVALATSRTRYADLYELAPVGYLTLSAQGVILEANRTATTLLGVVRSALAGQPLSQFILKEYQDIYYLFQKQLVASGKPQICELRMAKPDATPFWAQLHATTVANVAGMPECRLVLDDITERKQAEEELLQKTAALTAAHAKEAQEKRLLSAMMEALPTGVAITNALGGTIQTNSVYERIWGGPRPETQSVEDYTAYKAWWDDTNKPVAPEEWASAIAIQKGETTVGQVMRLQRFDGSDAFVINSASPVYDRGGNIVGSAVAIQDITALKQAEHALRKNREDFSRAQEVGGIGSWRLDVRRNVLAWSDENHRTFGVPQGTPLNYETFLSVVHPEDRAYVDTQWQAALRGEPYDIEHRLIVDGQIKWVREKAYLEFDKDGTLAGGFGITQNITECKQTEELIKQQVEELRASNEDLLQFNNAAVDRELRMIELKEEINKLCKQTGQLPRYPLDFQQGDVEANGQ